MKARLGILVFLVLAFGVVSSASRCAKENDASGSAPPTRDTAASKANGGETSDSRAAPIDTAATASGPVSGSRTTTIVRGVDDGSAPAARRLTSMDERLVPGNTAFGFALLKNTCGSGETKNIFISPLSVSVALAMTYNGASGNTEEEMASVLGFKGIALEELNQSMASLAAALVEADSAVELTIANSLWARKGFQFRSDFLQRNATYYGAETSSLDFADPGAPAVINGWVSGATRGLIDGIVTQIPREAVLYLINAIYFKGRWQTSFDPAATRDQPFHLAGGGEKTVPMMSRSGSFRYAEDRGVQLVRLPYGTGRMGMYVFLPRGADGLSGFLRTLDGSAFAEWISRLRSLEGDVFVPRFKIAYECGMVPTLKTLGMKDAFDASRADFSGMTGEAVAISEVKHKAVVEVNEEGTKAAAVTSVEIKATSITEPRERFSFIADAPFFFAIRDDATGSVLFVGAVFDPTS